MRVIRSNGLIRGYARMLRTVHPWRTFVAFRASVANKTDLAFE